MSARSDTQRRRQVSAPALAGMLLIAGFVALLAYGLAAIESDETINDSLAAGRAAPAPDLVLPLLTPGAPGPLSGRVKRAARDGGVALSELRGVPVVLNFWASWCPPCRTEAPRLERAWRSQRRPAALFLGLNMQDVSDDAREFIDEFDGSYPNVRDGSDATALTWGVTGLPETFFIDRRGRVVGHVIGAIGSGQLRDGIRAASLGRPRPALQGGDRRSTR